MAEEKGYCDQHGMNCVGIENLRERVQRLEKMLESVDDRVSELEKNTAVSKQEIKMIFNILKEIKDSIKIIAEEIKELKEKPAKRWDDATKTIVTVAITAIVTFIMSRLLN